MSEAVDLARELEEEDVRLAAEIESVAELQRRVSETGVRAAELEEFGRALPSERERLVRAVAEAGAELAAREAAVQALESAPVEDEAAARRAKVRARDQVTGAERHIERLREEQAELEAKAAAVPAEPSRLAAEAAEVTDALTTHAIPPPSPDPPSLVEWASRARAALLVERSGLDTRREQLVREANELASSVLGETVSSSVPGVRRRLEHAVRGRAP